MALNVAVSKISLAFILLLIVVIGAVVVSLSLIPATPQQLHALSNACLGLQRDFSEPVVRNLSSFKAFVIGHGCESERDEYAQQQARLQQNKERELAIKQVVR